MTLTLRSSFERSMSGCRLLRVSACSGLSGWLLLGCIGQYVSILFLELVSIFPPLDLLVLPTFITSPLVASIIPVISLCPLFPLVSLFALHVALLFPFFDYSPCQLHLGFYFSTCSPAFRRYIPPQTLPSPVALPVALEKSFQDLTAALSEELVDSVCQPPLLSVRVFNFILWF